MSRKVLILIFPEKNDLSGAAQNNDLWRWIEGLFADKSYEAPISVLRQRAARLENDHVLRAPGLVIKFSWNHRELKRNKISS